MTSKPTWFANQRDPAWSAPQPDPSAIAFHRRLPDYAVTPLVELPLIARELHVGRVFAKVESQRLGLPAFKALGASWAVSRVLDQMDGSRQVTVVTATDGNHGRAVARWAVHFGQRAKVLVPEGVHPDAIGAIRSEGADVELVDGTYDDAVELAARLARKVDHVLIQDTAWAGYEEIPGWIVDGYATLFVEVDQQLSDCGVRQPDMVVVPTGVGSLLQAALVHFRQRGGHVRTAVVSVEPDSAACVYASLTAGRPVSVATGITSMAGLSCGTISSLAWPIVASGLDAALVTNDTDVARSAEVLAELGVDAGPCGAASLAALSDVCGSEATTFRAHVGIDAASTVVLLITEGRSANPPRHKSR
ncbi:MAG: diaminopropionate ammonia-lyase [Acidimicrobiia bacterium]